MTVETLAEAVFVESLNREPNRASLSSDDLAPLIDHAHQIAESFHARERGPEPVRFTREWCERAADAEAGHEVMAGRDYSNATPEEIAALTPEQIRKARVVPGVKRSEPIDHSNGFKDRIDVTTEVEAFDRYEDRPFPPLRWGAELADQVLARMCRVTDPKQHQKDLRWLMRRGLGWQQAHDKVLEQLAMQHDALLKLQESAANTAAENERLKEEVKKADQSIHNLERIIDGLNQEVTAMEEIKAQANTIVQEHAKRGELIANLRRRLEDQTMECRALGMKLDNIHLLAKPKGDV